MRAHPRRENAVEVLLQARVVAGGWLNDLTVIQVPKGDADVTLLPVVITVEALLDRHRGIVRAIAHDHRRTAADRKVAMDPHHALPVRLSELHAFCVEHMPEVARRGPRTPARGHALRRAVAHVAAQRAHTGAQTALVVRNGIALERVEVGHTEPDVFARPRKEARGGAVHGRAGHQAVQRLVVDPPRVGAERVARAHQRGELVGAEGLALNKQDNVATRRRVGDAQLPDHRCVIRGGC